MRTLKLALFAATALSAVGPAMAQPADQIDPPHGVDAAPSSVADEPRTSTQPSEAGTPTVMQRTESGDPDEIIVTAQRRSERLTDVPISITTIDPQRMVSAGATSATDLDRITPGLVYATQASHAQPNIRGVGSQLTGPGADNNVAVYVDGVYQAAQSSLIMEFNNVERIEVLKGPQGTLFGRNATGGAITIRTLVPSFDPEARLALSYGRFDDWRVNAYVNLPIVDDVLAVNVAGLFRDEGGYIRNLAYDETVPGVKARAVNGKILIQPTSNFRIILNGLYSNRRDDKNEGLAPYLAPTPAYLSNPQFELPGPREINQNERPRWRTELYSLSARTELDLDVGTVSTITGYNNYKGDLGFDNDQSPLVGSFSALFDYSRMFSQELNFASRDFGAVNFVAGLFYYHDKSGRDQPISATQGGVPFLRTVSSVETDAWAAYAEANIDITDRLHAIAGLRYSEEKKHALGRRTIGTGPIIDARDNWSSLTPRFALRYDLTPYSNIYASYSRGFKSGVFNPAGLQTTSVDPENINAYEIGYKSGRRGFRFNAAAFYYDYTDLQVQSQLNAESLVFQNAASATIYGADIDFSFNLTEEFTIAGGVAYTHGRYDEFPGALTTVRDPVTQLVSVTYVDQSGATTVRTPEWNGNISATYRRQMGPGTFGATSTLSYMDSYFVSADNRVPVPSSWQLSGELSWTTADERYRFALWGKNLLDDDRLLWLTVGSLDLAIYDSPRTYGVSVSVNFK
jgi:iron complex outermembrane receptor protein